MPSNNSTIALLVTILFIAIEANAYNVALNTKKVPLNVLNAWTLPKPTNKNPFDTFKPSSFSASWYDDHNPTARKVIYNDFDEDEVYHFVVSFKSDDWINPHFESAPRTGEIVTRRPLGHFASKVYKRFRTLKY